MWTGNCEPYDEVEPSVVEHVRDRDEEDNSLFQLVAKASHRYSPGTGVNLNCRKQEHVVENKVSDLAPLGCAYC